MENIKETCQMLDHLICPGFCVKNQKIEYANAAALALLLTPGTEIGGCLATGAEEYAAFTGGCLYLRLRLDGGHWGASVSRVGDLDVFLLDADAGDPHLQTLALAAMELRQPLQNAIASADRLAVPEEERESLARLNRGLYQLHRIINNMSDAGRFSAISHQSSRDVGMVFDEIFEKAKTLLSRTGTSLTYQGLTEKTVALLDREQLERAVLNLLSNALKFTPAGGSIDATLSRQGSLLRLSILDSGSGISDSVLPHVFTRYLRQPGIEDPRFGLGLGMVLVRAAALNHGGTVLIDRPGKGGTRITMTLQLRQGQGSGLRTPIDLPGGQDPGLIELSECLPISVYEK